MKMTGTISIKDNYTETIKKAKETTDKFAKSIDDAKKNIDELKKQKKDIKVMLDAKKAQSDIEKMQKTLKETTGSGFSGKVYTATIKVRDMATSTIKSIGSSLLSLSKTAIVAGAAATAAGLGAGVYHSINLAGQMEQTRIAMGTLLKDQNKGDALVNQLKTFAIQTPFEFNDLAENTRYAMAMGFKSDDILSADNKSGLMVDVGNASSGLGIGAEGIQNIIRALGQMQQKGKVSAQEINQLAENGIGAWNYIAKSIGKTTAETMKLSEDGLIPADKAIQAIRKGMQNDFAGMMIKQSRTLLGLWSSLKDFVNLNVFASFGEGIRQGIIPYLSQLVDGLTNNQDALKSWSDKLTDAGKVAGDWVGKKGQELMSWFEQMSNRDDFKKADFGGKLTIALNDMMTKAKTWLNGDGGKSIQSLASGVVQITLDTFNAAAPQFASIGLTIGKEMLKGIGQGIGNWAKEPFVASSAADKWIEKKYGIPNTFLAHQAHPIEMTKYKGEFYNKWDKGLIDAEGNEIPGKASGISYVPRDNYPALLHKGERVLTAIDNKNYKSGTGFIVKMTNHVNASNPADVDSFLQKLEDKLWEVSNNMAVGGAG